MGRSISGRTHIYRRSKEERDSETANCEAANFATLNFPEHSGTETVRVDFHIRDRYAQQNLPGGIGIYIFDRAIGRLSTLINRSTDEQPCIH